MSSGRHAFQTCICSLIGFNSFFVLYLMCCFGNNPLYITGTCGQVPMMSPLFFLDVATPLFFSFLFLTSIFFFHINNILQLSMYHCMTYIQ